MLPEHVLEIDADSSAAEIEAAYDRHMSRWQPLLSHPTRRAEAEEMIARLDEARANLLAKLDTGEGGLRVEEARIGAKSAAVGKIDKNACPKCGYRDNPSRARFCIDCQAPLTKTCPNPKCQAELPWHQDVCDQCGANLETFLREQEAQERERLEKAIRQQEKRIFELQNDLSVLSSSAFVQPGIVNEAKDKYSQELGCGLGLVLTVFALVSWSTLNVIVFPWLPGTASDPLIVGTLIVNAAVAITLFYLVGRAILKGKTLKIIRSRIAEEQSRLRSMR